MFVRNTHTHTQVLSLRTDLGHRIWQVCKQHTHTASVATHVVMTQSLTRGIVTCVLCGFCPLPQVLKYAPPLVPFEERARLFQSEVSAARCVCVCVRVGVCVWVGVRVCVGVSVPVCVSRGPYSSEKGTTSSGSKER